VLRILSVAAFLARGIDEVPGAYKNIHDAMAAQSDLVDTVLDRIDHLLALSKERLRCDREKQQG